MNGNSESVKVLISHDPKKAVSHHRGKVEVSVFGNTAEDIAKALTELAEMFESGEYSNASISVGMDYSYTYKLSDIDRPDSVMQVVSRSGVSYINTNQPNDPDPARG